MSLSDFKAGTYASFKMSFHTDPFWVLVTKISWDRSNNGRDWRNSICEGIILTNGDDNYKKHHKRKLSLHGFHDFEDDLINCNLKYMGRSDGKCVLKHCNIENDDLDYARSLKYCDKCNDYKKHKYSHRHEIFFCSRCGNNKMK